MIAEAVAIPVLAPEMSLLGALDRARHPPSAQNGLYNDCLGPNVTFPQMTIYDSLRLHNVSVEGGSRAPGVRGSSKHHLANWTVGSGRAHGCVQQRNSAVSEGRFAP